MASNVDAVTGAFDDSGGLGGVGLGTNLVTASTAHVTLALCPAQPKTSHLHLDAMVVAQQSRLRERVGRRSGPHNSVCAARFERACDRPVALHVAVTRAQHI